MFELWFATITFPEAHNYHAWTKELLYLFKNINVSDEYPWIVNIAFALR